MLLGIAVLAAIVLTVMLLSRHKAVGMAGIIAMGLLMGSACPNVFGYMFSKVDAAYHGTSFGILFATGLAGGSVLPGLVGIVARKKSLRYGFIVNIIGAVAFGACALIIMTM